MISAFFFKNYVRLSGVFFLGAAAGLCFAPVSWWPVFFIALTVFLHSVFDQSFKTALQHFFCWSFGFFLVSTYWVSFSLGIDLKSLWFVVPFAVLGIPFLLASIHVGCWGVFLLLTRSRKKIFPPRYAFLFASAWALAEWVRSHILFGGAAWNLLSHMWSGVPMMMQSAALWGDSGLGLITIVLATLPFSLMHGWQKKKYWASVSVCCALLFGGLAAWRTRMDTELSVHPDVFLRLVQPNTPPSCRLAGPDTLNTLMRLTHQSGIDAITHIIWPEGAFPLHLLQGQLPKFFLNVLQEKQVLLTGLMHRNHAGIFNSAAAFSAAGHQLMDYPKVHLTPFGEYIPGRFLLEKLFNTSWMRAVTLGMQDLTPGRGMKTVKMKGLPTVSPLICFDVAFESSVTAIPRPQWLLELTNDAWFGKSFGVFQHLVLSRFRAIEAGLPLIRCTNTGITSVISPYGQVMKQLPLQVPGVLDTALPKGLSWTPYAMVRPWPFYIFFVLLSFCAFFGRTRPTGQKKKK